MAVDPGLASVVLAFGLAALCSAPAAHRAFRQRRAAIRVCLNCGRRLVNGVRQCTCDP